MRTLFAVALLLLLSAMSAGAEGDKITFDAPVAPPMSSATGLDYTIEIRPKVIVVRYTMTDSYGTFLWEGVEVWEGAAYDALANDNITLGMAGDNLLDTFKTKMGVALKARLNKTGTVQ